VMSDGSGGGRGGADESVTYLCVCVCVCVCVHVVGLPNAHRAWRADTLEMIPSEAPTLHPSRRRRSLVARASETAGLRLATPASTGACQTGPCK
jgi:hypothetical protein